MAWDITKGPPGIEGIHYWSLGSLAIYLNDLDGSFSQPLWPRIKLDRITGLHSRSEVDDNRERNTGRPGETPLPGVPAGKTVVYTGRIQALNDNDLRSMATLLRTVFTEESNLEGVMECRPHPTVGGTALRYTARCIQCDIDDEQTFSPWASPSPWQRSFTLGLRQSDARYYDAATPLSAGPFTSGSSHNVVNGGWARTDPVITGTAAGGATATLENLTSPATSLELDAVPAGTLVVDFVARSAQLGGTDIDQQITTYDWWDEGVAGLKPGTNSIKVTGLSNWSISWRNASW